MIPVADLCDMYENKPMYGSLRVLAPVFRNFDKCAVLAGPAPTLKVSEDNGLVCAVLEGQDAGHVLVIDGGGSLRCALMGSNFDKLAEENGWGGILPSGCMRDMHELAECNAGIHVLAVHPRKNIKKNAGQREVDVQMSGAYIQSSEWIYVDEDGVFVSQDMLE